jgi:hypothetical protein
VDEFGASDVEALSGYAFGGRCYKEERNWDQDVYMFINGTGCTYVDGVQYGRPGRIYGTYR